MSTFTKLSPQDVVRALGPMSYDKTRKVVFHLGVDSGILEDIDSSTLTDNRSIKAIQAWLDKDTDASWKKLCSVLKKLGMDAVAVRVAAEFCPQLLPTGIIPSSDADKPKALNPATTSHPMTPTVSSPPAGLQGSDSVTTSGQSVTSTPEPPTVPSTSTSAPISSFTSISPTVPPDQPQHSPQQPMSPNPYWCLDKVKTAITDLETKFLDLNTDTEEEMVKKEAQDKKFLRRFRKYIQLLPVSRKAPRVKFFQACEKEILAANDVQEILAIVCRYISYQNHSILVGIVVTFCSPQLQSDMQNYCSTLDMFEKSTTIYIYTTAISAGKNLKVAFSEMVLKINKSESDCTLYEVRKLKEEIAEAASLESHSVYIESEGVHCVEVVFSFLSSVAGRVLAVFTPQFLDDHLITTLILDGERMTAVPAETDILNKELLSVCKSGELVRAASLLNGGADIHTVNEYEQTPLDQASDYGHLQILCLLTDRGAVIDSRDDLGYTPLIAAALGGECDVIMELISLGADIEAQNKGGDTPLTAAAGGGQCDVIVELISLGANIEAHNKTGDSALIKAVLCGETEVVIQLIKARANLDIQNKGGDSALMKAAYWGKTEVVIQLIKARANLDLQDEYGDSAVIQAVQRYHPTVLKELVKAKSDVNLQNKEGLTALMMACRSGRSDMIEILLQGENVDLDIQQNDTGWSALFFTAERGDAASTDIILKAGANPTIKDKNGLTALQVASSSEMDTDIVCQLLTQASSTPHSHPDSGTLQGDSSVSEQDVVDTSHIISHQSTPRRTISETMRNLVNRSRKVATDIFNQLDRRLKSSDRKEQTSSGTGRETEKIKMKREREQSKTHTSSTTPQ